MLGGVWGTTIFARAQTACGFDAPNSQSQREAALAARTFGRDAGDVVVLYSSATLTAAGACVPVRGHQRAPSASARHGRVFRQLLVDRVARKFVSASGHQTYAVLELAGGSDSARQTSYDAIKTDLSVACSSPQSRSAG